MLTMMHVFWYLLIKHISIPRLAVRIPMTALADRVRTGDMLLSSSALGKLLYAAFNSPGILTGMLIGLICADASALMSEMPLVALQVRGARL